MRRRVPSPSFLVLIAAVLLVTGCRSAMRVPGFSSGPMAPQVITPTATAEQVAAAVNQNTARVNTYVTNNASIRIPGLPNLPLIQGNIAYQRPRRFRLQAGTALTGSDFDLGSNDQMFWLWSKQNEPPALYVARHDQYNASAARSMMPVEPDWVIDALGLVTIDPGNAQPPVPMQDGSLELRTTSQGPRGPVTRVLSIDPTRAWVKRQDVYDAQGNLLASAVAEQFRFHEAAQVSLPRRVTLRIPAAQLALTIDVGDVVVNGPVSDRLWQTPTIQDVPTVDLGAAPPTGVSAAPSARERAAGPHVMASSTTGAPGNTQPTRGRSEWAPARSADDGGSVYQLPATGGRLPDRSAAVTPPAR